MTRALLRATVIAAVCLLGFAQCPSASFRDPEPPASLAPLIAAPWAPNPAPFPTMRSPIVLPHNSSELVYLPIQQIPTDEEFVQRSACPHLDSGLSLWHDPATWPNGAVPNVAGMDVYLPPGKRVLISSCSIPQDLIFGYIHVVDTSALIFADANISVSARGIKVYTNASMQMGSPTCRLRSYITLTFYGTRPRPTVIVDSLEWEKGISASGRLEMHGARYSSTWSRLANDVQPGDRWIFVQERVNWEAGQIVLLTTTALKDSRDYHENETFNITRIYRAGMPGTIMENVTAVEVDRAVKFRHYAGSEYQAELALMSRRIVVRGAANDSDPTDNWPVTCYDNTYPDGYPCANSFRTGYGAQIRVMGMDAVGRIAGVMCHRCGQTNVLGHYPFHFHMMMGAANTSYLTDSSVYISYYRCISVHSVSGLRVLHNTAYNVIGFCYYLEDGVEELNIFINNLVAHVHFMGPYVVGDYNLSALSPNPVNGNSFQPDVYESPWLKLPADITASGFYITNANNYFSGNSAVGGWAAYAFPNLPKPVSLSKDVNMQPYTRPLMMFDGNSARSSAFWWSNAGCIYVGAWLTQETVDPYRLIYNAGKFSRPTPADGLPNIFSNNKMALCGNLALMHWGLKPQIDMFEIHDSFKSIVIFGTGTASAGRFKCRTGNLPNPRTFGGPEDRKFYTLSRNIFQWYDVGQQHIMYNISFRNCSKAATGINYNGFLMHTFSDEFAPEFMQASALIDYGDIDFNNSITPSPYKMTYPANHSITVPLAGRLQSWYDADGSATKRGKPTLVGSALARDWWKLDDKCELYPSWSVWACDKTPARGSASFFINYDIERQRLVGNAANGAATLNCSNGALSSGIYLRCDRVGQMTHVGRNFSTGLDLSLNTKITGPTGGYGWVTSFIDGAPKIFNITNIQVNVTEKLFFVTQYPPGTKFNISHRIQAETCNYCKPWNKPLGCLCAFYYRQVATREEVWNGRGDEYAFVDGFLYFRVTAQSSSNVGFNGTWALQDVPPAVSRFGLSVTGKLFGSKVMVRADCQTYDPGDLYCALADPLRVPPGPCLPNQTQTGIDTCTAVALPSPAPTGSAAATPSPAGTSAATSSPAGTGAATPTPAGTGAATPTPAGTSAATPTCSSAVTPTGAATPTGSSAITPTGSSAVTPTGSSAVTPTGSSAVTPTGSSAVTPTQTGSSAATPTRTVTGTASQTGAGAATQTQTGTGTASATQTGSGTAAPTQTGTGAATATRTGTGAATGTGTGASTPTPAGSGAATPSGSSAATPTRTGTGTATGAGTGAATATQTGSGAATPTRTGTGAATPTQTGSSAATATQTGSGFATASKTGSGAATSTASASKSGAASALASASASGSSSASRSRTAKATSSPSRSVSGTTTSRPASVGMAVVTADTTVLLAFGGGRRRAQTANLTSVRAGLSSDAEAMQRTGETLCAALVTTVSRLARFPAAETGATASPSSGAAMSTDSAAAVRCGGVRYIGTMAPAAGSRRLQASACNPLTADPSAGCTLTALELVISVVATVASAGSTAAPALYASALDGALASWSSVRAGMMNEMSALAGQEAGAALLAAGALSAPAPAAGSLLAAAPPSPAPDSGSSSTALIAGAVGGCLAAVAIAVALAVGIQRRNARRARGAVSAPPVTAAPEGQAQGFQFRASARGSFTPTMVNPGVGSPALRNAASSRAVGGAVGGVLSTVPAVMTRDAEGNLVDVSARDRSVSGRITAPYAGNRCPAQAGRMSAAPVAVAAAGDGSPRGAPVTVPASATVTLRVEEAGSYASAASADSELQHQAADGSGVQLTPPPAAANVGGSGCFSRMQRASLLAQPQRAAPGTPSAPAAVV